VLQRLNVLLIFVLLLLAGGVGTYLLYDARQTHNLVVAAGARSSEGFQLVQAIAEIVNRHHQKIRIEVIETGGSLDNSQLMDEGYADLATLQADGNISGRASLIANLYPDAYQLIARRAAGLKNGGGPERQDHRIAYKRIGAVHLFLVSGTPLRVG